ncbi:MAG: 50S ribosomal protein L25 [Anaerolineae bacterium]|nr:50S ribosomal protein L25 [Anaerolineae bacterium]
METLQLYATRRDVIGKQVKGLRRQGITPGVIYGHGIEPIAVQFNSHDLERSISKTGTSTTVQVHVEGIAEPYLAIFRDVQYHTTKRNVTHIDLQALNLQEKVRVPVSVVLVGAAPDVVDGGMVLQVMNELEIEALPMDLVPSIEIDISVLTTIGASIQVRDIIPPKGVTIFNLPNDTVVQMARMEAEEEAVEGEEAASASAEVEVLTTRKPTEE